MPQIIIERDQSAEVLVGDAIISAIALPAIYPEKI
jgi:hypothetical protein